LTFSWSALLASIFADRTLRSGSAAFFEHPAMDDPLTLIGAAGSAVAPRIASA